MTAIPRLTSLNIGYQLVFQYVINTICHQGSAAIEPCIANGGSPFWFTGYPRVTGEILTGPHSHPYRYCGMTSKKSISDMGNVRHRVDYPSTKNSSKEDAALPTLSSRIYLTGTQRVTDTLRHFQLSLLLTSAPSLCSLFLPQAVFSHA
ncbi:hypothetical protein [Photobacterium nomapromontoriensis]|uniref:hypothetical protein n=1 Tax=Photobacterium nomapromontoriensis TaxID=2910237 RepID=UPI003D135DB7